LYSTFNEFFVPMKLVRIVKMCLNGAYRKVRIREYLSNAFRIQNGLEQGSAFNIVLQFSFRIFCQEYARISGRTGILWNISAYGLCSRCK